jgi:hypothetical protein
MLYDLIGKMSTPEQVPEVMIGSVWYATKGSGAAGSKSILHIEKNRVRELVIDPDTYKKTPSDLGLPFRREDRRIQPVERHGNTYLQARKKECQPGAFCIRADQLRCRQSWLHL